MPKRGRLWTEYPKMFHDALDHFRMNPEAFEWKMQVSRNDAYAMRTQFYRFFDKIREEFRDVDQQTAENTGLDSAYHWANNLIISAAKFGEWWFIRLRKYAASDPERRTPPALKERLSEMSRAITAHQVQEREDEMKRVLGDWSDIQPTSSVEQIQQSAAASNTRLCPVTELPCRRSPKCSSVCIQNGEGLEKSV